MNQAGWGSNTDVIFDKKTGQRYIQRSERYEDFQYLKRYIQFLQDSFKSQDVEYLDRVFACESAECVLDVLDTKDGDSDCEKWLFKGSKMNILNFPGQWRT